MYKQWAQLKLSVSIYRYYLLGGATTYFVAPQFFQFVENQQRVNYLMNERSQMK